MVLNIGRSWDQAYKFIGFMAFVTVHNEKLTDQEAIWIGSEYMGLLLNSQTLISVTDSITTLRNEISYGTSGYYDLNTGLEFWPDLGTATKVGGITDLSGESNNAVVISADDDTVNFYSDDWKALMDVNGKDDGAVADISNVDSISNWTLSIEVFIDSVQTSHVEKYISGFKNGVESWSLWYNPTSNKYDFLIRNALGVVDSLFDTEANPSTAKHFVIVKTANKYTLFINGDSSQTVTSTIKPIPFNQIVLSPRNATSFRNLTVEKVANLAQRGVIGLEDKQMIVENCLIKYNHGVGLKGWNNSILRNNHVHKNGQMGISILDGIDALVLKNEIDSNNTTGFSPGWEAGGTKFWATYNLVVRGNYSYHNTGAGLWDDNDNIYILYEDNVVKGNTHYAGIFHEISYDAIIRDNILIENGHGYVTGWGWGAGIVVAASPNTNIYNNWVKDNYRGIVGLQQNRGSGVYGAWEIHNLKVYNNLIYFSAFGSSPANDRSVGIQRDYGDNSIFTSWNNSFYNNTYNTTTGLTVWKWMNVSNSFSTWQSTYGQDLTATINPSLSIANFTGGDTSGVGIDESISYGTTCPPGAIQIDTTSTIQTIINAYPAGTYYYLMPGNHRMAYSGNNATMLTPKTGDVYLGADGSVLNGSVLLTSFSYSAPYYSKTGLAHAGTVFGTGSFDAQYPEDLYVDNVLYIQEDALGDVGAGEWYFDYGANTVYMTDNPSGHKVELTSHTYGIRSTSSDTYTYSNGYLRAVRFYKDYNLSAIQVKSLYAVEQGQQAPVTNFVTKSEFNSTVNTINNSIATKLDTSDIFVSGSLTKSWDGTRLTLSGTGGGTASTDTLEGLIDSLSAVIHEQFEDLEATKYALYHTMAELDRVEQKRTFNTLTIPDSTGYGDVDSVILGETVTFGKVLFAESDGKAWTAEASDSAYLPALYLALEGGVANDTICVLRQGLVKCSGWTFALPSVLKVSGTAGLMTAAALTSGQWEQYVGVIVRTDVLDFRPDIRRVKIP